ncbi:folylpolyglutamate synthase, mitochondrial-like [Manduca sexta]|uniref:folylpolyglutamate synthase, mitochondrial-like n=1 Tax=Manduca sexta TaxID=7130 RepID=UPI00188EA3E8|nr:folylpolyglutamate synthase, mitochondrial-like [Manduca sexta]
MHSIRVCSVVNRIVVRMVSTKNSYEDAVGKLNKLQSNKSTIEQIRKEKAGHKCTNVEDMEYYLKRTGVSLSKLDEMSVIHVAGTKGKGSTSAMCESILRHHGFRTGFYSSPHLVAVRERIRLDGKVVSEEQFAHYFHEVYGKLDASKVVAL